ncbi:hypothetical protein Tco_0549480, partial [Tanacetum coccineum]
IVPERSFRVTFRSPIIFGEQDLQDRPDAYDKLCQLGPQRWSRAHCPLVRYNYLTSNSVESVNACTVVYRKLPVLKLAETYRAMVQEWYYKRRKLADVPLAAPPSPPPPPDRSTQTHYNVNRYSGSMASQSENADTESCERYMHLLYVWAPRWSDLMNKWTLEIGSDIVEATGTIKYTESLRYGIDNKYIENTDVAEKEEALISTLVIYTIEKNGS